MTDLKDKVAILKRETSIAWLWNYFGLSGKADRTCRSPFRDDKNPSFSVWSTPQGQKWKDHGTNESGDVIDFFAKVKGVSVGVALAELVKLRNISSPPAPRKLKEQNVTTFREPTAEECRKLGKLRGLDPAAFDLAGKLGTLRVGRHPETNELLWFLTDKTGKSSEGRTFDGTTCKATGKKMATLPGSRKDFPVGLETNNPDYDRLTRLVMVEGSPDYFAGIHMSIRIGINFRTCSMLGAYCNICEEAAQMFNNTCTVIMAHNDEPGQSAAQRWKDQLSRAENVFVTVQPLPTGIKDLNELMLCPLFSFTSVI